MTDFKLGDLVTGTRDPIRNGGANFGREVAFTGRVIDVESEGSLCLVVVEEIAPKPGINHMHNAKRLNRA